jgi:hypothetical protein
MAGDQLFTFTDNIAFVLDFSYYIYKLGKHPASLVYEGYDYYT